MGLFWLLTIYWLSSNKNKGLQDKYFKTLVRLYTSHLDEALKADGGVPLPLPVMLAALETDLYHLEICNPNGGGADLRHHCIHRQHSMYRQHLSPSQMMMRDFVGEKLQKLG